MRAARLTFRRWQAVMLLGLMAGCAVPQARIPPPAAREVKHVSFEHEADAPAPLPGDPADPFHGQSELAPEALVAEVQARNPSLRAMVEAWRAAAERYPQVVSLDDPVFGTMIGVRDGWMVEASQKIPWPGKRRLRGDAASAEANAACWDVEDARLRLAEAARTALAEYYLARRRSEVNAAIVDLMTQFRQIARVRYELAQASQQDVLQADVELADLAGRALELARDEQVAVARINTLLHRAADHPLPPPPQQWPVPDTVLPVQLLQELALQQRPDLAAQAWQIAAEEAALALASKEFYPDLEIVAKHDAFMPEDMRSQVGLNVNVPLWRQKRCAALREAAARLRQRRAEYEERVDQVRFEVQAAHQRLVQGRRLVEVYAQRSLPAAEESIKAVRASYEAGRLDFLRLLDAQRQLHAQRDKYHQAVADYHRRAAELHRAIGGALE